MGSQIPDEIDFNFHVRPILSDKCFACHGPDENARESSLRLDEEAYAFAPLDSQEQSFAIVPRDVRRSGLVDRIESNDPDFVMPPPDSKLALKAHEIEILKKWIAQGAAWKTHWAFNQPQPAGSGTDLHTSASTIDAIVSRRLAGEGLKMSPQASKEKLIRRLSFDLRGLPPSLEEIEDYVNNPDESAYERLVDTFLGQSSFGERMAMDWLDLARYADSHGYQDDIERSMWPWREWVIRAFNRNMPYDQFVTWQLAGDLLPNPSYEQKLATGFNRNHKITQEVGVIDEEYRVTYVLDRTNTFSTAFLGMTVECAQCHDHKFDPISQEEYYQLFGFFNQVPEKGRVDYGVEVAQPALPLPQSKIDSLRSYVAGLVDDQRQQIEAYAKKKWITKIESAAGSGKSEVNGFIPKGLLSWHALDHQVDHNTYPNTVGQHPAVGVNGPVLVPGKYGSGIECMGLNYAHTQSPKSFDLNQPFSISLWIKSLDGGIRGTAFSAFHPRNNTTFKIQVRSVKVLDISFSDERSKQKLILRTKETIPADQWVHVVVTHDGSLRGRGVNIYVNRQPKAVYIISDDLKRRLPKPQLLFLGTKYAIKDPRDSLSGHGENADPLRAGQLDELMIFSRALTKKDILALGAYDPIQSIRAKIDKSTTDHRRLFYNDLLHEDVLFREYTNRLREYKIKEGRTEEIIIKPTMIMQDMDTMRNTYILDRGQYDAPTREVAIGTPKAIKDFPSEYPQNRLGLAQWLFANDHPLTARVAVNRYWQMIFGRGLVATPGDFGSQGALPSHPDLLDHLAVAFMASGWDLKSLIKQMVMSVTYRQTTKITKVLKQKDPENILLGRGPQKRLSAEMVRDHALAISGLISDQIGGPSVKPYQPDGLWLEVASGNQSLRKYIQDHGMDLYRRSLYTFWKRTIPPPSMMIFDAPSREQCTIRRRSTSTPMQALVMLNDPQFTEAAKLLAQRMMLEGGKMVESRISFAFKLATSRTPTDKELQILVNLFEAEELSYASDQEATADLLSIGEYPLSKDMQRATTAAYVIVAHTILNMTETIMTS
ncbi:MAG: DUF1553 domain-containing protein [Saprospiraceae bacterium]|nr:DUF1553 domain-containing protein [Saprospiraceae bacterium]